MITVHPVGMLIAFGVVGGVASTLWWMLHPPRAKAEIAAERAEQQLQYLVGSVIVVFSAEIRSEHMMVLAARLARRQRAELLAAYIVEVPLTLPRNAVMEAEDRAALDTLAAAEAIAQKHGAQLRTVTIHHRQTSQAVLELAKQEKASLIIMGSYREGKYTGAPLGRAIEVIAANAECDVLIGVEGRHGSLLATQGEQERMART
jgi:nucleotide-binding universal stress UspA family protein